MSLDQSNRNMAFNGMFDMKPNIENANPNITEESNNYACSEHSIQTPSRKRVSNDSNDTQRKACRIVSDSKSVMVTNDSKSQNADQESDDNENFSPQCDRAWGTFNTHQGTKQVKRQEYEDYSEEGSEHRVPERIISSRNATVPECIISNRISDGDFNSKNVNSLDNQSDDDDDPNPRGRFTLDGVTYNTYQELVQAKRERNHKYLEAAGLLIKPKVPQKRVLIPKPQLPPRKSSRLEKDKAETKVVSNEKPLADSNSNCKTKTKSTYDFYRQRINDGSDLSIEEAVAKTDCDASSYKNVECYKNFIRSLKSKERTTRIEDLIAQRFPFFKNYPSLVKDFLEQSPDFSVYTNLIAPSPREKLSLSSSTCNQIRSLSGYDKKSVAEICNDPIYGIDIHPSKDRVIVSAGDRLGYVGIWNVDHQSLSLNSNYEPSNHVSHGVLSNATLAPNSIAGTDTDGGVYKFKYHTAAVASLQWTSNGEKLMSTSYDGTARWLDAEKQVSEQIFATYDASDEFKHKLGYGLGFSQLRYGCFDHRSGNDNCVFLSTSVGTVMHLDLRTQGRVTFHEKLGSKNINSLSLHPNGYSLITAGSDVTVRLWDIRKLSDSHRTEKSGQTLKKPLAEPSLGQAVISAFFSPSGQYAVATTKGNWHVFKNINLAYSPSWTTKGSGGNQLLPKPRAYQHVFPHGSRLSPFMPAFHPSYDIFCIGSIQQKAPSIDVIDPTHQHPQILRSVTGDAITSLNSRCCFHPRTDRIIIAGGDSVGQVTVIR